jgi:pSer/pThr/pTyr-binding forkhead associated (FHA) protein
MMSQGASQAAVGGTTVGGAAVSPNGTVENMMARLVIISTGAELPLPDQEEIMVGREDPSSGIFPDVDLTAYGGEEGGVSRRHARLLHINGDYFVEDLQSTNFTKLDGQRLPAHVRERLEDGARIDFGRVATIFRRS